MNLRLLVFLTEFIVTVYIQVSKSGTIQINKLVSFKTISSQWFCFLMFPGGRERVHWEQLG